MAVKNIVRWFLGKCERCNMAGPVAIFGFAFLCEDCYYDCKFQVEADEAVEIEYELADPSN